MLGNWSESDLAWIAPPPAQLASHNKSSFPLVHLSKRTIMYDVRLKRVAVETAVSIAVRNLKGSQVNDPQLVTPYRRPEDYRELLPQFFAMADSGALREAYSSGRRMEPKRRLWKPSRSTVLISSDQRRSASHE